MPTISQALLRNPTFPLIVPKAKWTTPQVNYSIAKNNQNQMQNTNIKTVIPRPRSSSLMVGLFFILIIYVCTIKSFLIGFSFLGAFYGGCYSTIS